MKQFLAIAQALADESRLRILKCLEGSTLCLCHLTEILGLAPSTVSKHLHILAEAGLIAGWQEGKWRFYRWADSDGIPCVLRALEWLGECLHGDPIAIDDAARRAVALQRCGAPCPKTARARVLFLCTGNSCRSQMAEGLLKKHAGERLEVYSAGLDPRPIPPLTFKVMQEIGIDISDQKPKDVRDFLGREYFGYLITVCASADERCPVFPGASYRLHWPVPDPAPAPGTEEERLATFRKVRDEIEARIVAWISELESGTSRGL